MKTVPWQNLKNLYKGGALRNLNFKILSMQDIKLAYKLSGSYGQGCRYKFLSMAAAAARDRRNFFYCFLLATYGIWGRGKYWFRDGKNEKKLLLIFTFKDFL
jgi:hypothetical protein